jgi:hypothetical protein
VRGGNRMRRSLWKRIVHPFIEKAFYLLVWRAILVTLIAVVLMVTHSFELTAAFLIGANVALLFSVVLIAWKSQLDEAHIVRTEAWRALRPGERPAGEAGRRWALNNLEELTLQFAKASSAVAIALAGTVLVTGTPVVGQFEFEPRHDPQEPRHPGTAKKQRCHQQYRAVRA